MGSALFIRQHFIPFDSPEEVYESVYGGEVDVVIEGVNSCYVIGNKDDKHFNRTENGWTSPIFNISVTKRIKTIGTTTISVSQYNFSEDYYVIVTETSSKSLILSDYRDSTFYQTYSKDTSNIQACGYCTYVHKINSEYVVTVNGVEVKLFE